MVFVHICRRRRGSLPSRGRGGVTNIARGSSEGSAKASIADCREWGDGVARRRFITTTTDTDADGAAHCSSGRHSGVRTVGSGIYGRTDVRWAAGHLPPTCRWLFARRRAMPRNSSVRRVASPSPGLPGSDCAQGRAWQPQHTARKLRR